jgi:CheY-like chemotaxis protein
VLIIDDDEQYLKLTARVLRGAGYEVVVRSVVIGTSVAVAAERPDMVLIDLNMPVLDGDRLAPLIQRAAISNPPLLVLYSGLSEKILGERALACGAHATIQKGLAPEQFLECVARVFANGPGAGLFASVSKS